MLDTLVIDETPLRIFHIALFVADHFGIKEQFWLQLLANTPDPPSANALASIAIRTFIERDIISVGPSEAVRRVGIILSPETTWSSLGLSTFTDERIGQSLTPQLKTDLATAMNGFSIAWLSALNQELSSEIAMAMNPPEPEPESNP